MYVETQKVSFATLEQTLRAKLGAEPDTYISLHVDKSVPVNYVVKVMNIAKDNGYKLVLATSAK